MDKNVLFLSLFEFVFKKSIYLNINSKGTHSSSRPSSKHVYFELHSTYCQIHKPILTHGVWCVSHSLFLPWGPSVDSTLITPAPSWYMLSTTLIIFSFHKKKCYLLAVVTVFSANEMFGSEPNQTFYSLAWSNYSS